MSKIVILGDSGNKDSALQAYRTAYRSTVDEAYQFINEEAAHILRNNYEVSPSQLQSALPDRLLNQRNRHIYRQIRQLINVDNFYYEQAEDSNVRCFRCFISASLAENQMYALSRKLAKYQYQLLYIALNNNFKEQA